MEVKININGDECYITEKNLPMERTVIKNIDKYEILLYESIAHIIDSI